MMTTREEALEALKRCWKPRGGRLDLDMEAAWDFVGTYEDEIRAALSPPPDEVMEWRPIETAPIAKNVLVAVGKKVTYAALYEGKKQGWWGYDGSPLKTQPTHWMPLPKPPEEKD